MPVVSQDSDAPGHLAAGAGGAWRDHLWWPTSRLTAGRGRLSSDTAYAIALAAMVVAGAVLRFSFLAAKSIWLDEAMSAHQVSQLSSVFLRAEMPIYHLILYCWVLIAGNSEAMLRTPSVFFAVATIPLIAELGTELSDRATGLLSALLLTVHETAIQHAQTARGYALLMMLVTLSSLFFVRSVKRGTLANCTGYVVSGTSVIYAHLFGILILPAQCASVFLFRPGRRIANRVIVSALAIGVLSVPAFALAIRAYQGQDDWIPSISRWAFTQLFYILSGASRDIIPGSAAVAFSLMGFRFGLSSLLLWSYLAAIALAMAYPGRESIGAKLYLLLSIVTPICLTIIVSHFKHLFVIRYLLVVLPFFVVAAAMGIRQIPWRSAAVAVAAAISVMSLVEDYSYYRTPSFQDWRSAVTFVAARADSGDVLMIYPNYYEIPVQYYVGRLPGSTVFPRIILMKDELRSRAPARWREDAVSWNRSVVSNLDQGIRVWFFSASWDDDDQRLLAEMQDDHHVVEQPDIPGVRLLLFVSGRKSLR
jgi:4-amino-4-deoxy-L-arabinose transferase-like glycosyltransferase